MNTSGRIGHEGPLRTDHNNRLLCIGHRGNDHDGRPISFGCCYGSYRRHDGSHQDGVDDPVIMVARYPDFGKIAAPSILRTGAIVVWLSMLYSHWSTV